VKTTKSRHSSPLLHTPPQHSSAINLTAKQ
jgi:hypothetical protein